MARGNRGGGGFTLVELLTVVAILSIIAMVAMPNLLNARGKASRKEAMTNIMAIAVLLERFYADLGSSYTDGRGRCGVTRTYCSEQCGQSCDGGQSLDPNLDGVPDLVITGKGFVYTVTARDGPDADRLCEEYAITAAPCGQGMKQDRDSQWTLTYTNTGARLGPWE